MRRITLFHTLQRQPESGPSRALITASSGYGLTQGGYAAEVLSLTDRGRAIVEKNDLRAKLDAVLQVDIFRSFIERYRDAVIPAQAAAQDFLKSQGIPEPSINTCLDIFLKTAKQVGLIQEISGRERIVSPEYVIDLINQKSNEANKDTLKEKHESNELKPENENPIHNPTTAISTKPTLHIDIQIHISSDATTEQIDQIFASMAKHLYNRG